MAIMKILLFLLLLLVGFHLCSCDNEMVNRRRKPTPPRSPPPPPPNPLQCPPPPQRSRPPPRTPPPPPPPNPLQCPPPPQRSRPRPRTPPPPPPNPLQCPPPPPQRSRPPPRTPPTPTPRPPPPPNPLQCPPPPQRSRPPPRTPPTPTPRPPPPPNPFRSPPPCRCRHPPPQSSPPRPPPRAAPPPPRLGFDFFNLVLQWPNALCRQKFRSNCKPYVPKQYFTIHGLRPQKSGEKSPKKCYPREPLTDEILENFREKLLEIWPRLYSANDFDKSKRFWYEEWNKHGSCSSDKFPPKEYFQKTIDLGSKYGPLIRKKMEDEGIEPDGKTEYSSAKILEAIKKATGYDAVIRCTHDSYHRVQLSEIRLCVQNDAENLQNCEVAYPGCFADPVFASEPFPRSP